VESAPSEVAAQADELDAAVREVSDYFNTRLPRGNKLVFLNIQSDFPALSEYIIDELIANTVNDRVFSVVDRQQLDAIRAELDFQMSGEVDDDSAQALGRMLGAQTIVSGAVSQIGDLYRLRIRALGVENAQIQGQFNRNIPDGPTVTALVNSRATGYGSATTASSAPAPAVSQAAPSSSAATPTAATPVPAVPGATSTAANSVATSSVQSTVPASPAPAVSPSASPAAKTFPAPENFRLIRTITNNLSVSFAAFSPDGTKIVSGNTPDGNIKFWDVNSGRLLNEFPKQPYISSLAYSPDGRRIASGTTEVRIWDVSTAAYRVAANFSSWVHALTYAPDGKQLAALSGAGISIFDANSGRLIREIKNYIVQGSWAITYSPDGKRIAWGYNLQHTTAKVNIYDVDSGEIISELLPSRDNFLSCVTWSPDGSMIAAAVGQNIEVWNVTSKEKIWTLTGHTGEIRGVAFSPDGKSIVSGSRDNTIKIWDIESGWEIKTFQNVHDSYFESLSYSPDGRHFLTTSQDKTIKIWGVD
jgi:WD40 repeat protein